MPDSNACVSSYDPRADEDYRYPSAKPTMPKIRFLKEKLKHELHHCSHEISSSKDKIGKNGSPVFIEFSQIYDTKCVYCGAPIGLFSIGDFEIDHFLPKSSFSPNHKTINGKRKVKADRLSNLVLACKNCNQHKLALRITDSAIKLLNPDSLHLSKIFIRDGDYSIKISQAYGQNEDVKEFYYQLQLYRQEYRLDFVLMRIDMYLHKYDYPSLYKIKDKLLTLRNTIPRTSSIS